MFQSLGAHGEGALQPGTLIPELNFWQDYCILMTFGVSPTISNMTTVLTRDIQELPSCALQEHAVPLYSPSPSAAGLPLAPAVGSRPQHLAQKEPALRPGKAWLPEMPSRVCSRG